MTALNDSQLMTLIRQSPALDAIAPSLPEPLQARLLDLQKRAGDAYAAGSWRTKAGDLVEVPPRSVPPTVEEAQSALGQAYLVQDDHKRALKGLMDDMGLTPSARRAGILAQLSDTLKGWFR